MYFIPKNVRARTEFFKGVGFKEFIIIMGIFIASIIIALLFNLLGCGLLTCFIIVAFITSAGAGLFIEYSPGKSFIKDIQDHLHYKRSIKYYSYIFGAGRKEDHR